MNRAGGFAADAFQVRQAARSVGSRQSATAPPCGHTDQSFATRALPQAAIGPWRQPARVSRTTIRRRSAKGLPLTVPAAAA